MMDYHRMTDYYHDHRMIQYYGIIDFYKKKDHDRMIDYYDRLL